MAELDEKSRHDQIHSPGGSLMSGPNSIAIRPIFLKTLKTTNVSVMMAPEGKQGITKENRIQLVGIMRNPSSGSFEHLATRKAAKNNRRLKPKPQSLMSWKSDDKGFAVHWKILQPIWLFKIWNQKLWLEKQNKNNQTSQATKILLSLIFNIDK